MTFVIPHNPQNFLILWIIGKDFKFLNLGLFATIIQHTLVSSHFQRMFFFGCLFPFISEREKQQNHWTTLKQYVRRKINSLMGTSQNISSVCSHLHKRCKIKHLPSISGCDFTTPIIFTVRKHFLHIQSNLPP